MDNNNQEFSSQPNPSEVTTASDFSTESNLKKQLTSVTPLSKYLAMALFIILPFIGGWIGYQFAPVKVVDTELPTQQPNAQTVEKEELVEVAQVDITEDRKVGEMPEDWVLFKPTDDIAIYYPPELQPSDGIIDFKSWSKDTNKFLENTETFWYCDSVDSANEVAIGAAPCDGEARGFTFSVYAEELNQGYFEKYNQFTTVYRNGELEGDGVWVYQYAEGPSCSVHIATMYAGKHVNLRLACDNYNPDNSELYVSEFAETLWNSLSLGEQVAELESSPGREMGTELFFVPTTESCVSGINEEQRAQCKRTIWSRKNEYGYSRYSSYPANRTLTGTYRQYIYADPTSKPLYEYDGLHFLPDESDYALLPKSEYVTPDWQINFADQEAAETLLGISIDSENLTGDRCVVSGSATVEISDMVIDNFEGGVPLSFRATAQLDQVIERGPYSIDCQ